MLVPTQDPHEEGRTRRLRELQQALHKKTELRRSKEIDSSSPFGLRAAHSHWLIDLSEGAELVQASDLTPVPLTVTWYLGLLSFRHRLIGVIDLAAWMGCPVSPLQSSEKLLVLPEASGLALRLQEVIGWVESSTLHRLERASPQPWVKAVMGDEQGREWLYLNIASLLQDPVFLKIGLDPDA